MSTNTQTDPAVNPNKALWEKGDFTRIASSMRRSGEALVATLEVTPGLDVLDLGCGDGTTAVPAAQLGANVLGVDIAANLVAAGNARAQGLGLTNLRFQEGDATDLKELADDSFDLVVSIFGAMFAPRPFDVAKEVVRVTRPGGRIVMGNWIPNDPTFVAQLLRISSAYSPPPPEGFVSPMTWGVEENVVERFVAAGVPGRKRLVRAGDVHVRVPGNAVGVPRRVPRLLRTDDERLCRCRGRRPGGRAACRARGARQRAQHGGRRRGNHDPGDVPPRDGRGLRDYPDSSERLNDSTVRARSLLANRAATGFINRITPKS